MATFRHCHKRLASGLAMMALLWDADVNSVPARRCRGDRAFRA